ncbi:MAG: hypothetical protein KA807_06400 [Prolixibacteraceae bacterium]|nr:hypothetical protein [Prolixibacteraceae bacterium]
MAYLMVRKQTITPLPPKSLTLIELQFNMIIRHLLQYHNSEYQGGFPSSNPEDNETNDRNDISLKNRG